MGKSLNLLLLLIFFSFSILSCSNEIDPESLPSFAGINTDENTVYFLTENGYNRADGSGEHETGKICAIDTKTSKKIYTYQFKRHIVKSLVYDPSFDINPYIILDQYSRIKEKVVKIDVKTGELKKINLDFDVDFFILGPLNIINNKLLIPNNYRDYLTDSYNEKCFVYDIKNGSSSYIDFPAGMLQNNKISLNNNDYFYIQNYNKNGIYNFTTGTMLADNVFTQNYKSCFFYCNKYMFALDNSTNTPNLFLIDSFEPDLVYTHLFTYNNSTNYSYVVYEDNNYLYSIDNEIDSGEEEYINEKVTIKKIDKQQNYDVVETKTLVGGWFKGYNVQSYYRNGYIWCLNGPIYYSSSTNIYRIDTNDLSVRIID